ncbi:aspartate kinase [Vibrio marisflavi]|uniref:Aspartokinase n=1 Tax=Vibrio marisflavi CECT 7928 TaxID=634439 RepID=A0ABN8E5Q9_9VIBR|nr:aspartate kinase [Vibrio marisflavi]CAH0538593.1 Uridylate kinase [Vibrio marisflavi CECT 7928]
MKKPLIVQKFGGTSVGSVDRIHAVAKHIIKAKNDGNQVVVVVSAMSGETNRLMSLAQQVDNVPHARELDVLLSAGEQVSMALLAMTLGKLGYPARSLTGGQAKILTNNQFNDATITHIDTTPIKRLLDQESIVIVAGFQGINTEGDITTLGRGGSDTTAVTLAGALRADECQIFTDVDGIYTCDPRVVPTARKLDSIDFPTMEEMARKGAKVLHLPSVQYAWQNDVPLRVLSTFDNGPGSLVKGEDCPRPVCGLALQRSLLSVQFSSDQMASVVQQCQMLGIQIWGTTTDQQFGNIMINQQQLAKLNLLFENEINHVEPTSLLTLVGGRAGELISSASELLAQHMIKIVHFDVNERSLMLFLSAESIDKAANLLHDSYIATNEMLEIHQKRA